MPGTTAKNNKKVGAAHSPSNLTDTCVSVPPVSDSRPPISKEAKDLLDRLSFKDQTEHPNFQMFIVHYGTLMVAHSVMFLKASEVVNGNRTEESFCLTLAGKNPPRPQFPVQRPLIGSLKAISQEVYVPPCAFQSSTLKSGDVPVPFLDSDLGNLFVDSPSAFFHSPAMEKAVAFTYRIRTLPQLFQTDTIKEGLAFTEEGLRKAILTHKTLLQRGDSSEPEGAGVLINYYTNVVDFYCSRSRQSLR